jgi:multiple sugar transport system permease protein
VRRGLDSRKAASVTASTNEVRAAAAAGADSPPPEAPPSRGRRRRTDTLAAYLFLTPWLLGTVVFLLGPLLFSVYLSLTDWSFAGRPEWVGTENFERMFTDDYRFWLSLKITGIYLLISVPVYMVFGLAGALLLNVKAWGMRMFRTILFLPSVLSGVAIAVLWMQLLNPQSGAVNTVLRNLGVEDPPSWFLDPEWAIPAMVLTNAWAIIGGGAIIYLAGLQNIDPALYESAALDGAGSMRRFRHVTLPMLTPTLFFQLIITVIAAFQIFDTAFTVGRGSSDSLLFYLIYMWQTAFRDGQLGYGAALSLFFFAVGVAVVVVLMRTSDRWVFDDNA